jgi:non-specific serine/threonine protein kinase
MYRMATLKWQGQQEGLSGRGAEILRLLAEGMSDREIAEHLVMSINTIKWYNRQIYSILGVGSRTQAIARAHELAMFDQEGADRTLKMLPLSPSHNLPTETTRFIGRSTELTVIERVLEESHLLTLVGPPGTGKTRLAMQVARRMLMRFSDGVYVVPLATVSDPTQVAIAIANAVGVYVSADQPVFDTLKQTIREQQLLLVLDNFEHLLPGALQVADLLAAAPRLKVLTTSREPLNLYAEREYVVPPLALPDLDHLDMHELAACESVALFMQQARSVRSDFELTPANAPDIALICVRLEGLPLAIELAAARVKLLTPSALLARLESRLNTLKGGAQDLPARQRTLQNSIDWSYNLLTEGEKLLFARLAAFHGGCSLEAAQAVCSAGLPMAVWDGLESLINKSLIQQKALPTGEPRLDMLETLHEYAWERLEASGEAAAIRQRHAEYYLELAERAEPELCTARQSHWFRQLEADHENMRAVLHWALEGGNIAHGVRLAGALGLFWFACGYHFEGHQQTQRLLAHVESLTTVADAKLLLTAANLTFLSDLGVAQRYCEQALRIARAQGDKFTEAWAVICLGYSMMTEMDAALAVAEDGLALFRSLKHRPGIAHALHIIGDIACFNHDHVKARQAYVECLHVSQETGDTRRVRLLFSNFTILAQREEDYDHARVLAERSLQMAREVNNKLDIADSLAGLAGVLGATGQPERAVRLLGAWEAALERMGAKPQPADKPEHDRNITRLRTQLTPSAFNEAWGAGRTMSLDQALALTLDLNVS